MKLVLYQSLGIVEHVRGGYTKGTTPPATGHTVSNSANRRNRSFHGETARQADRHYYQKLTSCHYGTEVREPLRGDVVVTF